MPRPPGWEPLFFLFNIYRFSACSTFYWFLWKNIFHHFHRGKCHARTLDINKQIEFYNFTIASENFFPILTCWRGKITFSFQKLSQITWMLSVQLANQLNWNRCHKYWTCYSLTETTGMDFFVIISFLAAHWSFRHCFSICFCLS